MVIEGKHINQLLVVFHEIFLIDVDCIYLYILYIYIHTHTPVHTRYNMPLFDITPLKVSLFFFLIFLMSQWNFSSHGVLSGSRDPAGREVQRAQGHWGSHGLVR